jgi:hypothetical protein
MVPAACTVVQRTWGFPPYRALARELNFRNEGGKECGSLSQGENGLSQAKTVYRSSESGLPQRRKRFIATAKTAYRWS